MQNIVLRSPSYFMMVLFLGQQLPRFQPLERRKEGLEDKGTFLDFRS